MQKYFTSFTDIPYKAGTFNHATRRRLLTYFGTWHVAWYGTRRGRGEVSDIVQGGIGRTMKRENQG